MSEIVTHRFYPEEKQSKISNLVQVMVHKAEEGTSLDRELDHLYKLSGHRAVDTDFSDYQSWTSLEDLIKRYQLQPVPQGIKLDKDQIVRLLKCYNEYISDEAVSEYYLNYLEDNLPVSVVNIIFHQSETDDVHHLADMLLNAPEEKAVLL